MPDADGMATEREWLEGLRPEDREAHEADRQSAIPSLEEMVERAACERYQREEGDAWPGGTGVTQGHYRSEAEADLKAAGVPELLEIVASGQVADHEWFVGVASDGKIDRTWPAACEGREPPHSLMGDAARIAKVVTVDRLRAVEDRLARYQTALREADEAMRRMTVVGIALADDLDQPYPDDPRWTPWTRFMKPALSRIEKARKAICAALPSRNSNDDERTEDGG